MTLKPPLPALLTKRAADKIKFPDEVDVTVDAFNVRVPPATSVDVDPALTLAPRVKAPVALRLTAPLKETGLLMVNAFEVPEIVAVKDPEPLMLLAMVVSVLRLNNKVALSVMLPLILPELPPFPICSVPAEMVVTPVAVLAPVNVNVPLPVLVSPTDVALPFCKTPLKLVEVLSPPAVNVNVPAAELVIVPAPANEATVSEWPPKSNVAPELTVSAELSDITPPDAPSFNVPKLTVVAPL